eukprot:TRINITY_DN29333_c0_g1_i1.p1 TRINITY_DN29333_c0_g1~~TRINITY_DN29333_c0_g1_i1.p1  ORF type:complete len:204 (-),score=75.53 TRINITY_DN29333_c0_g1_i1:135-716(-)
MDWEPPKKLRKMLFTTKEEDEAAEKKIEEGQVKVLDEDSNNMDVDEDNETKDQKGRWKNWTKQEDKEQREHQWKDNPDEWDWHDKKGGKDWQSKRDFKYRESHGTWPDKKSSWWNDNYYNHKKSGWGSGGWKSDEKSDDKGRGKAYSSTSWKRSSSYNWSRNRKWDNWTNWKKSKEEEEAEEQKGGGAPWRRW